MSGATLLEYYVYIISPVEDENLSPDGSRGMSVSAHWHTRKRIRCLGHTELLQSKLHSRSHGETLAVKLSNNGRKIK